MENTTQVQTLAGHPDGRTPCNALAAVHWTCSGLCLVLVGWIVGAMTLSPFEEHSGWPIAALLIAASVSTVISLSRSLPLQNALLAAMVIGLLGGFVETVGTLTGIPFGSDRFTSAAGPRFFGTLPWWIPLLWIIAILNSRGTARLILRLWRQTRNYGFWLIGLTIVLCLVFDLGLELFATPIKGYWMWSPARFTPMWNGIPPIHFLIQAILLLAILVVVTPLLINKKPVEFPPDYHPFLLWTLANLVFLTGAFAGHFWLTAAFVAGTILVTGSFALHGAKR